MEPAPVLAEGVAGSARLHEDVGVTHGVGSRARRGFRLDVRGRFDEDVLDFRRRAGFCGIVHSSSPLVLGMGGRRPSGAEAWESRIGRKDAQGGSPWAEGYRGEFREGAYATHRRVRPGAGHGGSRGLGWGAPAGVGSIPGRLRPGAGGMRRSPGLPGPVSPGERTGR